MKKILFTWELGAGLGHIQPIKQRCELLPQYALYAALQNLRTAQAVLAGTSVTLLQAPYLQALPEQPIVYTKCFSDLLYNNGFASRALLGGLVRGWRTLFELIEPDLVVFDHSPSALLAARAYPFKKVITGSGFMCPPATEPFTVFFPDQLSTEDRQQVLQTEQTVLNVCNTVMPQVPLQHISELYGSVDKVLLTTLPQFDHFYRPAGADYLGFHSAPSGKKPQWPAIDGKRIYAYLKPFPELPWFLQRLKQSGQPTIIYSNNIDQALLQQHQADNICFEPEPLDLQQVAADCDFAIINSNYDTGCQLLAAGIPLMTMPLSREQQVLTAKLLDTGACVAAHPADRDRMLQALNAMSSDSVYKQAAITLSTELRALYSGDVLHGFTESINSLF